MTVMPRPDERREFQRLNLDPPIPGTLGSTAVSVLEVGILGARVQHAAPLDEQHAELRFSYREREIALRCEVVRTMESDSQYPDTGLQSGIRFVAAIGESGDLLRQMLVELVTEELDKSRKISLAMEREIDGDKTIRGKDAAYLSFRLEGGNWNKRHVFLPEQPPVGFTVGRMTDGDDLKRLCLVYEASDDEGRRLIRMFAELSVSAVLGIPPRA
jgi:hypothetical protein